MNLQSNSSERRSAPIKILVIDDDDVDREKILRLLKDLPMLFEVSEGSSGKEALKLLLDRQFDCAILDYYLKDGLGSELIEAIKNHSIEPTPIIMISGNSDERIVADAMREGVFDYLPKRTLKSEQLHGALTSGLKWAEDKYKLLITQQALANSEQKFRAAFDYAPLGMALIALDGSVIQANSALYKLLCYDHSGETENLKQINIKQFSHHADCKAENGKLQLLTEKKSPFVQYEKRLVNKNGRTIPVLVSAALLNRGYEDDCFLLQIYDLSERKRYEKRLVKLAHFDELTGLGNRTKLHEEIDFLIQKSARQMMPFAVLFGDIDYFKQVNDGLGHEAGDQLLKIVAKRLKVSLRRGDIVTRLGGDEFVILLQNIQKYEPVVAVVEKLIQSVKASIRLKEAEVYVSISFGIAVYPSDGDDAKTLLRNADSALYDAKEKGRSCYQFYRKELTEYIQNRLLLDRDLRNAIVNKEFELHFQPVVNLQTQEIDSAEALIRWNHPKRGILFPDEFIGYAQETGLIIRIDEWVIDEACRKVSEWGTKGFITNIAINISARQFQNQLLVELVKNTLEKYNLSADRLIIEITEQMLLEHTEVNLQQISQLKDLGVKISLDDFGIGFSSLSYIIRFSPHYLKIDRSFVSKIGQANEHDEMVRAIIGLSKVIPMNIVGEGIETESQRDFLKKLGCHFAQGYFFSRPLTEDKLLLFLDKWPK